MWDGNDLVHFGGLNAPQVSRWRRLCRSFVDTAGLDAETVKFLPERFSGLAAIAVEIAAANADELPSCSLKVALARHVLFVALRTVPFVAVAFDGKAPLHPLDDEVDAVAVIGRDRRRTPACARESPRPLITPKTSRSNSESNFWVAPSADLAAGVEHVAQQAIAHACRAEDIKSCRVEKPQLILRAAGGDIEPLARGIIGQHPYPGFAWGSHHAEEDDVRSSP